ncbi:hypothetical protein HMSSN036_82080 [Paenibacillus macerans]|nr:hypothetical protein HMSSN036_82080 [Paenibacillus macerans]
MGRSMDLTADAIKKVARRHFALKGYEATSLDAIAKEIGIKKQSLYNAHPKQKRAVQHGI